MHKLKSPAIKCTTKITGKILKLRNDCIDIDNLKYLDRATGQFIDMSGHILTIKGFRGGNLGSEICFTASLRITEKFVEKLVIDTIVVDIVTRYTVKDVCDITFA